MGQTGPWPSPLSHSSLGILTGPVLEAVSAHSTAACASAARRLKTRSKGAAGLCCGRTERLCFLCHLGPQGHFCRACWLPPPCPISFLTFRGTSPQVGSRAQATSGRCDKCSFWSRCSATLRTVHRDCVLEELLFVPGDEVQLSDLHLVCVASDRRLQ